MPLNCSIAIAVALQPQPLQQRIEDEDEGLQVDVQDPNHYVVFDQVRVPLNSMQIPNALHKSWASGRRQHTRWGSTRPCEASKVLQKAILQLRCRCTRY